MAHLKIDTGIFKYNIFAMIQNVCHMSLYSVTNNLCHISCTTFLFSLISSNNFKLLLKLLLGHCTKLVKIKVPQKLILNLLLRTRSSYGNWVHSTFNLFTNTNWCMTLDIGKFMATVQWLLYVFVHSLNDLGELGTLSHPHDVIGVIALKGLLWTMPFVMI